MQTSNNSIQTPQSVDLVIEARWIAILDTEHVFLEHYAAGTNPTRPEIPSVILTANLVSALPSLFPIPSPAALTITGAAPTVT